MKKVIFWVLGVLAGVVAVFLLLIQTGVVWRSPPYYTAAEGAVFSVPIMGMAAYREMEHDRPYVYTLKNNHGGSVAVLGIEHTRDPNDPQLEKLRSEWKALDPTAALVEGRLGFLLSGLQDPVKEYGEAGLAAALAGQKGIPLYTWEPDRQTEINLLLKRFSPEQLALFYALRPYFSNFRFGKPADPDKTLQEYIDDRTDYPGIKGVITSVDQVDGIWKRDFPTLKDWRDTSDEYGWPEGYLYEIWDASNMARDIHLCSAILELMKKGERVFAVMGSSHAFRIRQALEAAVGQQFGHRPRDA